MIKRQKRAVVKLDIRGAKEIRRAGAALKELREEFGRENVKVLHADDIRMVVEYKTYGTPHA